MEDATETRDKKRLLCLHVRAYVAVTYQLCFRDVNNREKGSDKSRLYSMKERDSGTRRRKKGDTQMRGMSVIKEK